MTYVCARCGSENICIKQANKRTGMYCSDCGAWIQWLSYREMLRTYNHMKESGLLPDGRAYKRVSQFKTGRIVKCSNCGCQLFHSESPKPLGQFDLIDAKFCPQCGWEFL